MKKEIGHAFNVIRTVNVEHRMGLTVSFAGMMLNQPESNTRQPFSGTWIKDYLLERQLERNHDRQAELDRGI